MTDDCKTEDVVFVRHGKWLPQKLLGKRVWDCSECKMLGNPIYRYCPHCGAKMDGKDGGRMTYEEAKSLFEQDLKDGKCSDDCPECNARELAISALEKQIPKKPIENGIGGYICPHCGGVILDFTHELYHRDCGGRLE